MNKQVEKQGVKNNSPILKKEPTEIRKRFLNSSLDEEDQTLKTSRLDISGFLATLSTYVAERQGERDDMQDANTCILDYIKDYSAVKPKINRASYFAIFDGHGGKQASEYCAKNLHIHLIRHSPNGNSPSFDKEIKRSIIQAFKSIDEDFLKLAANNQPVWKDGTTVCMLLVLDDNLYIVNLGDSKAVLCRYQKHIKKHVALSLSQEHNPSNYDERKRIEKSGGFVRDGRVLGILEVSRSIGDGQYKRCGVINVPDVKRYQFRNDDRFILMACDGLWKVFNPEEAIDFILQIIQDSSLVPPNDSIKSVEAFRFETACNKLASEAVRRGSSDNVTVLIVSICKL